MSSDDDPGLEADLLGTGPIALRSGNGSRVTITFNKRGDCVKVEIAPARGEALGPRDLRLRWGDLILTARKLRRRKMIRTLDTLDARLTAAGIDVLSSSHPLARAIRERDAHQMREVDRQRSRKGLPIKEPDFYLRVAAEYCRLIEEDASPKPSAMLALWARREGQRNASPNTAAQWVRRARQMGYLTAAPGPRRSGGRLTAKAKKELQLLELAATADSPSA